MAFVRINGNYIDCTIGPVLDLQWSNRWPGGSWDASWVMDLPKNFPHTQLRVNALVEIMVGPTVVWSGHLDRPQPGADVWEFSAIGKCRLAERFLCLNASSASTTTPHTAVDRAIIRGLQWTSTLAGTTAIVTGDVTNGINFLDTLLDAYANELGQRWAIDPTGLLYFSVDPGPTLLTVPNVGNLGIADEQSASRLFGRYMPTSTTFSTVNVTDADAQASRGFTEQPVDLTAYGAITSGRATAYLNALLTKGATQPAWAGSLTVAEGQLTGTGGGPVCLAMVGMEPEAVRVPGVVSPVNDLIGYIDFIVGETRYRNGAKDIELIPGNALIDDLEGSFAAASPKLRA